MAVELVLMGVEGSGKSTVGPRVATALQVPYFDADNFHSADAIARMSAGVPLDDTERHPWLERLHELLVEHGGSGAVLACSALKPSYRSVLANGLPVSDDYEIPFRWTGELREVVVEAGADLGRPVPDEVRAAVHSE